MIHPCRAPVIEIPRLRLSHLFSWLLNNRFARNWSLLVTSNVGCQALGMLAMIRVARALAPESYGQYNLVQTIAGLGTVLAGLGVRNVIIRQCARHPEDTTRVFYATLILQSVLMALVAAGIIVYNQFSTQGFSTGFNAITIGLLAGQCVWDLMESVAFGHERMGYSAGLNFSGSVIWVLLAWVVPRTWLTALNVSAAFAILQGLKAFGYAYLANRTRLLVGVFRRPWLPLGCSLLRQSLPFYWLGLLTAATSQLPILFLAERSGSVEVGLFNVAFRLINPIQMLTSTALTALYPGLAQAGFRDEERFLRMIKRALLGITLLGTSGALFVSLIRQELVGFLFGAEYQGSANAMAFQCWYAVLYSILCLIGTSLAARDKQKRLAALSTAYAVIATPMLWFGSGHGATGLAAATLVAAAVNLTYHWFVFQRSLPQVLTASFTIKGIIIIGVALVLSVAFPPTASLLQRLFVSGCLLVLISAAVVREIRQHPGLIHHAT